jgi:hypothetical protein
MSKTWMPALGIVVAEHVFVESKEMMVMRTRLGLLVLGFLTAASVIVTVLTAAAAPVAVLAGTSWDN